MLAQQCCRTNGVAALQEAIDWLAKPENLQQTDNLPPFIENLDIGAYVATALPIAGFVLGVNVLDEVVQRGVALQRKVPLRHPHGSHTQAYARVHSALETPHPCLAQTYLTLYRAFPANAVMEWPGNISLLV